MKRGADKAGEHTIHRHVANVFGKLGLSPQSRMRPAAASSGPVPSIFPIRMARSGHLLSCPEHGPSRGSRLFPLPLEWSVQVAVGKERRRKGDDRDRRRCTDELEDGSGIRRRRPRGRAKQTMNRGRRSWTR
jgi:hypothetical protein